MTIFKRIGVILHLAGLFSGSYGLYAQNLISNSTLDTFTVYNSNRLNGESLIYPDHWFQISYNNTSLYCYESLFPGRLINSFYYFNVDPEELSRNKGCIRIELDPEPDLVYSKLRHPLERDTEYHFKMSVLLSTVFPEIITFPIRFQKGKPDSVMQTETSILLSIPDTSQIKLKNNHWITLEGNFKARGGEEYIILGTRDKEHFINQFSDSIVKKYRDYKTTHRITYYDKEDIEFYSLINIMVVDSLVLIPTSINKNPINQETMVRSLMKNDSVIFPKSVSVYFSPDQFFLSDSAKQELKEFVSYCLLNISANILVFGYTDNKDDEKYNYTLSVKRAESVSDFLVKSGLPDKRLEIVGKGMKNPKYSNGTINGQMRNRRVDIFIVEKNQ